MNFGKFNKRCKKISDELFVSEFREKDVEKAFFANLRIAINFILSGYIKLAFISKALNKLKEKGNLSNKKTKKVEKYIEFLNIFFTHLNAMNDEVLININELKNG